MVVGEVIDVEDVDARRPVLSQAEASSREERRPGPPSSREDRFHDRQHHNQRHQDRLFLSLFLLSVAGDGLLLCLFLPSRSL